jgi:2-polyprenyl-3-methyl-5-hydroxy-6-metoxy-1,4-benzoquinol methylase
MTGIRRADPSNGYEAIAGAFMSARSRSRIGAAIVRDWARSLPPGASVLDLGCGHGVPVSAALIDAGLVVHGIDASPSMIAAFAERFPGVPVECSAIEDSQFFGRPFDAVVAWGLIFLLAPDTQATLIHKAAVALKPGGRLLFTAPGRACEWPDNLTGQKSVSLGSDRYREIVASEGLSLVGETEDEGQNHYYFVGKSGDAG